METHQVNSGEFAKLLEKCPECGDDQVLVVDDYQEARGCDTCKIQWHVCKPQRKMFILRGLRGDIFCGVDHDPDVDIPDDE